MIGKMAIATALRGFNDLGHLVTLLLFPEANFVYNDLHIVQKWRKIERGKLKKNLRFLSTGLRILPSCNCMVRETIVAKFELVL